MVGKSILPFLGVGRSHDGDIEVAQGIYKLTLAPQLAAHFVVLKGSIRPEMIDQYIVNFYVLKINHKKYNVTPGINAKV